MYCLTELMNQLKNLGLKMNDTVLVHSSLNKIGPVVGGPVAIIKSIENTITDRGTLVMPTFTEHLCDPIEFNHYTQEENQFIRQNMPIYYKDLTPVDKVNGFLTEVFRKQDGVLRSDHPHLSFAAWGNQKEYIIKNHELNYALGELSPLGKLYSLDAKVLLLGSPFDACTALHLSEYSIKTLFESLKYWKAKIIKDGVEQWIDYKDIDNDNQYFPSIIDSYQQNGGKYNQGKFGEADSYLFPMRELVTYGIKWMKSYR